jgi:hypothetical protein
MKSGNKDVGKRRLPMGDRGKKAKEKGKKQQIAKHDQEAKRKQDKQRKATP